MKLESLILRALALLALLAALLAMVSIISSSGILGGGASEGAAQPGGKDPVATTAPAEATSTAAASEPAAEHKTYTVEDGDSFYSVARKFNTSISEIQKLNPNIDPQNLSAGTKLALP